jgi:hypothetical protein
MKDVGFRSALPDLLAANDECQAARLDPIGSPSNKLPRSKQRGIENLIESCYAASGGEFNPEYRLKELVRDCIKAGRLRELDEDVIATAMAAASHGLITMILYCPNFLNNATVALL